MVAMLGAILGVGCELNDTAFDVVPKELPEQVAILLGQGRAKGRSSTSDMCIHGTGKVSMVIFKPLPSGLRCQSKSVLGKLLHCHRLHRLQLGGVLQDVKRAELVVLRVGLLQLRKWV